MPPAKYICVYLAVNVIAAQNLICESHTILTYTMQDTDQTAKYIQIITRSTSKRSASTYYCCVEPYQYKRSAFHSI